MNERFAQLTFASADRAGRSGGWQVQEVRGELSATERAFLLDGVVPRLPEGEPIPEYPSAAEVGRLPRRLVYRLHDEIGGVWWHTTPCGRDSQGRPGNVFVHVVLDRAAASPAAGALRPSDLCGVDWLRPFGQAEVIAASLDGVADLPWTPAPGRARVLEFLGRQGLSISALCVLLDAVHAAMDGGLHVALGLRQLDSAPDWIAAICHLMSPRTARRLTWSTWERAAELTARPPEVHLAVVPYEDALGLGHQLAAVVEDEALPRAGRGQPSRVVRSESQIAVTTWSELFYEVARPDWLRGVLAEMDRVAEEAGEEEPLSPAWPLAMVVNKRGNKIADAMPAAWAVLKDSSPAHLGARSKDLYRPFLARLSDQVGPGVGPAWSAVSEARQSGNASRIEVATDLFLLRALEDPSWREVTGPVDDLRPHRDGQVAIAVTEVVQRRLDALFAEFGTEFSPDRYLPMTRAVLGFLDLVHLAGIEPEPPAGQALDELHGWIADLLLDPIQGPALTVALSDVGAARQRLAEVVAARMQEWGGEPGTRVLPVVLRLLGVRLPAPEQLGNGQPDPLQSELAAQLCLVDTDPRARAWLVCAWDMLDRPQGFDALLEPGRTRRYLRGATCWDGYALAVLMRHPKAHRLHGPAVEALLGLPPGREAERLLDAVHHRPGVPSPVPDGRGPLDDARQLRLLACGAPTPAILDLASRVLAGRPVEFVDDVIWQAVLAAHLAAAIRGAWEHPAPYEQPVPAPVPDQGLARAGRTPDGRARIAWLLADDKTVPPVALAHAAICLERGRPEGVALAELRRALGLVRAEGERTPVHRAAMTRARARRFSDQDRVAVRTRLRGDERAGGRWAFGDRGTEPDADVDAWWKAVVLREGGGA